MSFLRANFAPIGGQATRGRAPQIFSYKTEDAAAAVDSAGYFNEVYDLLEIGDIIHRVTTSSGAFSTYGIHAVNAKASGVIDVTDATAGTVTDTD